MKLKDIKINIYVAISINIAIIAFLDSFVMWNDPLPGKLLTYGLKLLNIPAFFFLLLKNKMQNYVWALAALPLVWYVWDEKSLVLSLQYLYSATLPVLCFLLLKEELQIYTVKVYLRIIFYLLCIGLIIYIPINILPVPHLNYQRGLDSRTYENYFFLYYTMGYVRFRFSSVFDEPGVVGTLAAIVVFFYRDFLSKREYVVYIVAGFLSMSLFFIVTFPALYFFSALRNMTPLQRLKRLIIFQIAAVFIYFAFVVALNSVKDDPVMKFALYNRFKWENGLITGVVNNRDILGGFDDGYQELWSKQGAPLWVGHGKNAVTEHFGASGLSYRISIYEKGLLLMLYVAGMILVILPWRTNVIFSIVSVAFIVALLFQRTLFFKIDYFILIFVGAGLLSKYEKEKNRTYFA